MKNIPQPRPQFWERFSLDELTGTEWEALCDGCGACCLIKFKDDDSDAVEYTDVACQLLDCATAACRHYPERRAYVPDCISLTPQNISEMYWLPMTCAYKRLYLGKPLPDWHHLKTGDRALSQQLMRQKNISMAGRCVSEQQVSEIEQETRIIHWIAQ